MAGKDNRLIVPPTAWITSIGLVVQEEQSFGKFLGSSINVNLGTPILFW